MSTDRDLDTAVYKTILSDNLEHTAVIINNNFRKIGKKVC